jgi:hypothetical protein
MITHYCIIRNRTIISKGKKIYSLDQGSLIDFLDNAYTFLKINYPKFYKMDNLSKLGFLAAEVIMKEALPAADFSPEAMAVILSNANSSMDTDLRYLESAKTVASPALFVYTLPNIVAGEICIRHKIKGENIFFIAPSFDATLLTEYVSLVMGSSSLMPNATMPNACLAGWVDVLGGQHDVFLYLFEKDKITATEHAPEKLKELYNTALWNN